MEKWNLVFVARFRWQWTRVIDMASMVCLPKEALMVQQQCPQSRCL